MVTDDGPARTGGFMIGTVSTDKACSDWEDYAEDLEYNLFIGMTLSEQSVLSDKAISHRRSAS